ncbi:matrixin family metalloprotease [Paenibacillus amylolyticus]|uniref:Matrixin family metalloprotease n=1 Tax=Paenibacillus amylolyticus TaxID=1451 RepID=A0ABD8B2F0_PAEAM
MPKADLERIVNLRMVKELPELKLGEQHPDFMQVQIYLKRFGYFHEDALETGELDEGTSRALARFQQRYSIGKPGVFDEATRDFMSQDRCGQPDTQDPLAFATVCPWGRRNLTFAFGPLSGQVSNQVAQNAVRRAFATWSAAGVGFTFAEVGVNQNPDIQIEWRRAADPDHSMVGGILAHADFPPGCSIIVNNLPLPVHFDDQEHTWMDGAAVNAFDIETVALHEIGHILGLGHTNVSGSVMFPTISDNFTLRNLQPDDLTGIQVLYPTTQIRSQTAARNADGRLEVFGIGMNNALWNIWQTAPSSGPWSNWNSLGGGVKQISAALNQDGRLEVFAIGIDDALWNIWQTAPSVGPWSEWNRLGGGVKQIAASCNSDGRLEVFAIGMDNGLWNIWQTRPSTGPWSNWNSLGGGVKQIVPALNQDGRLEVFAIGMDNALWNIWQTVPSSGPWSNWNSLGGGVKQIASTLNRDGRLELFAIGMDDALWNIWQTAPSSGPWSGWSSLAGGVKQITAACNSDGRLEVFGIGTDDALWNIWQTAPSSGPWSGWNRLGGVGKNISVVLNQDGRLEAFGIGMNDTLWNIWQTAPASGPWSGWGELPH